MTTMMTAPVTHPAEVTFPQPSLARLTRVELRKARDTRAGLWLLIAIAIGTVAIQIVHALAADDKDKNFDSFFSTALLVQSLLIPVLGILLVTSEWSQRTGLVSFTLEPIRSRIVVAKLGAALVLGVASLGFAFVMGAAATAVAGSGDAWNLGIGNFGEFSLTQVLSVVQGVAFGMLLMNSAAAIVTFFVVPTAWAILFGSWSALDSVKDWIDISSATEPLYNHEMTASAWAHVVVAATIWTVLPLVIGIRRLLRAELK